MLAYILTPADHAAFQLWNSDHRGLVRKAVRSWLWVGISAILLSSLVGLGLGHGRNLSTVTITAAVALAVWIGLTPLWRVLERHRLARRLNAWARREKTPLPVRLWLDDAGLNLDLEEGSEHTAWAGLGGVEETPHHVFVKLGESSVYIIPRRADPAQVALVADQIRVRCGRPLAPAAECAPSALVQPEPAAEPVSWVPPAGVVPLSEFAVTGQAPGAAALSFVLTVEDITTSVFHRPGQREAMEQRFWSTWWRRQLRRLPAVFLLTLAASLWVLHTPPAGAMVLAVVAMIGAGVADRARGAHVLRDSLLSTLERKARTHLAEHGEVRRLWADTEALTVASAVATVRIPWREVAVHQSDRCDVISWNSGSIPVPRRLGRPAADFLAFARSRTTRDW